VLRVLDETVEGRKRSLIAKQIFPKTLRLIAPQQEQTSQKSRATRIRQFDKASADGFGAAPYRAGRQSVCQGRRNNLRVGAVHAHKSGRGQCFNCIEDGVRVSPEGCAEDVRLACCVPVDADMRH